jgi:glycosyltransferase involved in cell wall biosynthesis
MRTLHVVMPVYNEPTTLATSVARVLAAPMPTDWQVRVVLVDDGSDSETLATVRDLGSHEGVTALFHPKNRGKGAAIRTGFAHVLSFATDDDAILIQDADLEYDPADFPALLAPAAIGDADLVLGNRWATPPKGFKRLAHRMLNGLLTLASNLATGLKVHDMECCFKLFTVPAMQRIMGDLDEERFGIEPQIVAAAARRGLRVAEAPVSYAPRTFEEGKKIRMKDGVRVFVVLWRERARTRRAMRHARSVHSGA